MLLAHHMDNTDKAAYWEQMREAMDTDGDGKISRQEYIDFNKNNSMSMSAANNLKMELQNKGFPKTAAAAEEAAATDVAPAAENPAPGEPAAEAAAEAAPAPAAE